jgi:hypothetical protein
MHITVQPVSPLPDPIEAEMAHLLDAVEDESARVEAFDATLAAPGCRIRRCVLRCSASRALPRGHLNPAHCPRTVRWYSLDQRAKPLTIGIKSCGGLMII